MPDQSVIKFLANGELLLALLNVATAIGIIWGLWKPARTTFSFMRNWYRGSFRRSLRILKIGRWRRAVMSAQDVHRLVSEIVMIGVVLAIAIVFLLVSFSIFSTLELSKDAPLDDKFTATIMVFGALTMFTFVSWAFPVMLWRIEVVKSRVRTRRFRDIRLRDEKARSN